MELKSKTKKSVELMYDGLIYEITKYGTDIDTKVASFFLETYPDLVEKKEKIEVEIEEK